MSMMRDNNYDLYRFDSAMPSWQKIERYEYCEQEPREHVSLQGLYKKLKTLVMSWML